MKTVFYNKNRLSLFAGLLLLLSGVAMAETNPVVTLNFSSPTNLVEETSFSGSIGTTGSNLTISAVASPTNIIGPISFDPTSGSNPDATNRQIQFDGLLNATGTVTVTITSSNTVGSTNVAFDVNVTNVNDDPTNSVPLDVIMDEDTSTNVVVSIGDVDNLDGDLSLVLLSSTNTLLFNSPTFSNTGPAGTRFIDLSPLTNQFGFTEIQFAVSDGISTNPLTTFNVTVKNVNDPPTLAPISDLNLDEDVPTNVVITIDDIDSPITSLVVTAVSSDGSILSISGSNISGAGTTNLTRTLSLLSLTNQNGVVTNTVTVSDGEFTNSQSFVLTINPVNDPPTITGSLDFTVNDDTNAYPFASVVIGDVDQDTPDQEGLKAIIEAEGGDSGSGLFEYMGSSTSRLEIVGTTPSNLTTILANDVVYRPFPDQGVVGLVITSLYTLTVQDHQSNTTPPMQFSTSSTGEITVVSVNDIPTVTLSVNPSLVYDDTGSVRPFSVTIDDADLAEQYTVSLVSSSLPGVWSLNPIPTNYTGSDSQIQTFIEGITFDPVENIVTNDAVIEFSLVLVDAFSEVVTNQQTLILRERNDLPSVSGFPNGDLATDDGTGVSPFSGLNVQDPDQQGSQLLTVSVFSLNTNLGDFAQSSTSGVTSAEATTWLNTVLFQPVENSVPVGSKSSVNVGVTINDGNAVVTDSETVIQITGVNGAPKINDINDILLSQPFPIPPSDPRPFKDLSISDDGSDPLEFQITLDSSDKGVLSNATGVVGFGETSVGSGVYTAMLVEAELNLLFTNLIFVVDTNYNFPANLYGDTTFQILVEDSLGNTDSETARIYLEDSSRNILVTRTDDDVLEGSLRYAMLKALPNDVISFAFTNHPSVIRLQSTLLVTKPLTFQGPGADLLTISGDSDGDGLPNHQIFRVFSPFTLEGLTVSHGTANGGSGGAIYVGVEGALTLKECVIANSEAGTYGGGVDVDRGFISADRCSFINNRTDPSSGISGGALSIYTDQACSIANSTFSGNQQANPSSDDGGGALSVENYNDQTILNVDFQHCTFAENTDAAETATAIFSIVAKTRVRLENSIFADGQGHNLNVDGGGDILSLGGNLSDDTTYTSFQQGGSQVYLLDTNNNDQISVTNILLGPLTYLEGPTPVHPLLPGSAAIDSAPDRIQAIDQVSRFREGSPDGGAYEFGALQRVVINEVQTQDTPDDFIELYIPRNGDDTDLSGFQLFVDDVMHHEFETNSVIKAGRGIVVADSIITAQGTPLTPVVTASPLMNLEDYGTIVLKTPEPESLPVASYRYNNNFLSISNVFVAANYTSDSITLNPQFLGYAFLPHSFYGSGTTSPGADSEGLGFGAKNAVPNAGDDRFVINEDDLSVLPVLFNDVDRDRTDQLIVTGVPSNSCGVSAAQALYCVYTNPPSVVADSVLYDPRLASPLQSLAEGAEQSDIFTYQVTDLGGGVITSNSSAGGGQTRLYSIAHRLTTGDVATITGAGVYDGARSVVSTTNDDSFVIGVPFSTSVTNGVWSMMRTNDQADVEVIVIGVNDAPVPGLDSLTAAEDEVLRVLGDTNLIGSGVIFETDGAFGSNVTLASSTLLQNDVDIDTDDSDLTLNVVGVLDQVGVISEFTGTSSLAPVTIVSTNHGLTNGMSVLVSVTTNYPAYNGTHEITVIDSNQFSIAIPYDEDQPMSSMPGFWGVLADGSPTLATSLLGADVKLEIRASREETSLVYDPRGSAILDSLAVGETGHDVFYYAVEDRHSAVSIGEINVEVSGVNDIPVLQPDPDPIDVLLPFTNPSNSLSDVIAGLEILDSVQSVSGAPGKRDVRVIPPGLTEADSIVLFNLCSTTEDVDLVIPWEDLLNNDSDADESDVLILSDATLSTYGVTNSLDSVVSNLTYFASLSSNLNKLAHGELLLDSFDTVVSDQNGGVVTSSVAVLVLGVNDTPIAVDDFDATLEDVPLVLYPITHPSNDMSRWDIEFDINGSAPDDQLWILPQSNSLSFRDGLVNVDLASRLNYDPSVSAFLNELAIWQSTTDRFDYVVTDQSLVYACDDVFRVQADGANFTLNVLVNDRNFNRRGGGLSIIEVGLPNGDGVVSRVVDTNGTGTAIHYTPEINFVGDEVFTYTVSDPYGNISRARVTARVTLEPINGALQANDDFFSVAMNETIQLDVKANDNRLPLSGSGLTITGINTNGTVGNIVLSGNEITYLGTTNLTDEFSYTVNGGGSATATAKVVVVVIDRSKSLPVQNDCYRISQDSVQNEFNVTQNDRILPDETTFTILGIEVSPVHGVVSINSNNNTLVYTPVAGYLGSDTFSYRISDGLGGGGIGNVLVQVGKLNTQNDTFTIPQNAPSTAINVLANDRILPAGQGTLSINFVSPTNTPLGDMSINGGALYFTPSTNVTGSTSFVYRVKESGTSTGTAEAVLNLTVSGEGVYANPDEYFVRMDEETVQLNVLINDRSIRSTDKEVVVVSVGISPNAPNQGGVVVPSSDGRSLLYTPAIGFSGEETFTYTISDSLGTDEARVIVRVSEPQIVTCEDRFIVYYDQTGSTQFDLPVLNNDRFLPSLNGLLSITGTGMDDPGGANAPSEGGVVSISPNGSSLIYVPETNRSAFTSYEETFTYEVGDGGSERVEGKVFVTVRKRDDALLPATKEDRYSVNRNSADNILPLLINDGVLPDSAEDWDLTSLSTPDQGGLAVKFGQAIQYTPRPDFLGTERFTYAVSDGLGGTATAGVQVVVGNILLNPDCFTAISSSGPYELDVLANDSSSPDTNYVLKLDLAQNSSEGGNVSVSSGVVQYEPSSTYTGVYPYVETFEYSVTNDSSFGLTQKVSVMVLELNSDISTGTVFITVQGVNDVPEIDNSPLNPDILDKEIAQPFQAVTFTEYDLQLMELLDITIELDDAEKGLLRNLGGFVEGPDGTYILSNVTAAAATLLIHPVIFDPTENRITAETNETTYFTITATDTNGASATDTNSFIEVTAVNDAPTITGTRGDLTTFYLTPIRLFSSVTIGDVDDLELQHLALTVTLSDPDHGVLTNLTSFVMVTNGVYGATNLSPAEATAELRAMQFLVGSSGIPVGTNQVTQFDIEVDDGFAPEVVDGVTMVTALNGFEGQLQPTNTLGQGLFGFSVDTLAEISVVGSPFVLTNGPAAGAAFVYDYIPGRVPEWQEQLILQPSNVDTNDNFGWSVAIDEDLIAVGAISDEVAGIEVGSVYIFQRDKGGPDMWGQVARVTSSNLTAGSEFGFSVDLQGECLAVGAPRADLTNGAVQGAVYVFEQHLGGSNAWGQTAVQFATGAGTTNSDFGWSVSLSGDQLAVGAPENNSDVTDATTEGAVYILSRNQGGTDRWGVTTNIPAPEIDLSREFGYDVSLSDGKLAVGAPATTVGSKGNAGAAYFYQYNVASNLWYLSQTLQEGLTSNSERYGYSLAQNGYLLLVGAPENSGANQGAAYLYKPAMTGSSNVWSLLNKYSRPQGSPAGLYGTSVGLHPETAIIGAPINLNFNNSQGFAFMYRFRYNNAPFLAVAIEDQVTEVGVPYSFEIPATTFEDPDDGDVLTLQVTFLVGSNGLSLVDQTITGTPVSVGSTAVEVTALDASGDSAGDTFQVFVLSAGQLPITPRSLWDHQNFTNAVTNLLVSGGSANPDGDGSNNDEEYVYGGNPNSVDTQGISIISDGQGSCVVSFLRRTNDPELTYRLQEAIVMSGPWRDAPESSFMEMSAPFDDEFEQVSIIVPVDLSDPYIYFRILVTR